MIPSEYPFNCAVCGKPPGWQLVESADAQEKVLRFECHGEQEQHTIDYNFLSGRPKYPIPIPFAGSPRAGEGIPLPDSIAGIL